MLLPGLSCYPSLAWLRAAQEDVPRWKIRPAGFFLLASASPAARTTLRLRAGSTSHVTVGGRAALKSSNGRKEAKNVRLGLVAALGYSVEGEAKFGGGNAAGAHTPPVDEEAPGEGHRDLLAATRVGVAQFVPGPEEAAVVGLELEQAPRPLRRTRSAAGDCRACRSVRVASACRSSPPLATGQ